jgi:hypothetical protein
MTLATATTSQGYHLRGRDLPMKPLPFKKRSHEKQGAIAFENALSLRWQAMVSHRRYLAKQQQQQYHSNGFSLYGYESGSARPTMISLRAKFKKQVRFAPTATVNTRSVTQDDLDNSWYTDEQYISFERENREIVAFVCQAGGDVSKLDPEKYSVIGLEHYIEGRKQMMARRLKTMQHSAMVLEMYDVLRCNGIVDPEVVRKVSERCS